MATTLGGATLAEPIIDTEGSGYELAPKGVVTEMADGTVKLDYLDVDRRVFYLAWYNLTTTQKDAIETKARVAAVQAFSPPEVGTTYNVIVSPGSFRAASREDGNGASGSLWDVELELIETGT